MDNFEGLYLEDYAEQEKRQFEAKVKNDELMLAYNHMMKDPYGRRVLWDILEMCGVFQLSFTGNSKTYFLEGKRSIGLYLTTMLNLGTRLEDLTPEGAFQKLKPNE